MQEFAAGKFHVEPPFTSFDHLVGAREQRGGNFEADRACGRQVDDQFKLGRLYYRKVGRLGTLEDFPSLDADLAVRFRLARSIAHQSASLRIFPYILDGGKRMAARQRGQLDASG